jgi:hypothetical protein
MAAASSARAPKHADGLFNFLPLLLYRDSNSHVSHIAVQKKGQGWCGFVQSLTALCKN